MIICKNLTKTDSISTLNEWFLNCSPQGKIKQWKNGRSAKETAKHWLYTIPLEFRDILKCFKLDFKLCSPEHVSYFDKYTGNGRNHDLLINATNPNREKFIISVESKVDEEFGPTIGKYLDKIQKKKNNGQNSNADKRIEDLRKAIFPNISISDFGELKYQLLTAIAGTLAEAKKQEAKKAVFLVQTFISNNMKSKLHRQNQLDFDYLIKLLTNGKQEIIHDGDLVGPFTFPGNEFIPDNVELWVGKYDVKI
jgi:hypothetical protein